MGSSCSRVMNASKARIVRLGNRTFFVISVMNERELVWLTSSEGRALQKISGTAHGSERRETWVSLCQDTRVPD